MLFSLKIQRDNRKNALSVDLAKGKTGEKGCIFTVRWRWNDHKLYRTNFNKNIKLLLWSSLLRPCQSVWLFYLHSMMKPQTFSPVFSSMDSAFGFLLVRLYQSIWLFHPHSTVKIQPFSPVSPWRNPRLRHVVGYSFGSSRKKASAIFCDAAFSLMHLGRIVVLHITIWNFLKTIFLWFKNS